MKEFLMELVCYIVVIFMLCGFVCLTIQMLVWITKLFI